MYLQYKTDEREESNHRNRVIDHISTEATQCTVIQMKDCQALFDHLSVVKDKPPTVVYSIGSIIVEYIQVRKLTLRTLLRARNHSSQASMTPWQIHDQ
jgi:hypothetical protein